MTSHLPHRLLALAVVCSAQFLVVLDITIVNVALPAIGDDLDLDAGGLQWVVSAYAVVFGGFLLLAGRVSDLHGPRRTFQSGLLLFGAASLLCGLAPSGPALLAARGLQGLGGALVSPAALAVLVRTFPDGPARARALGIWGSVGALAAASGVFVGGAVVELTSWRWVFLVNVPVVVAAVAAAPLAGLAGTEPSARRPRIDALTAALLTCGLGALVAALAEAGSRGAGDRLTLALAACSAALVAACVRRERRAAEPLVPLAVLSSPARLAANGTGALLGAIMLASFLLLTLQLQVLLGLSPLAAGAALLAARGTGFAITPVMTRIAARCGGRPLLLGGMLAMAASMLLLARVPADGSYATDVLPGLLVLGLAVPTLFLGTSLVALEGVQPAQSGVASALLTTSQWLGGAIGVALATAVAGPGAGVDGSEALADGLRTGYVLAAALALAGAVVAAILLREPRTADGTPARRAYWRPFVGRRRPVQQAPRASVAGCL